MKHNILNWSRRIKTKNNRLSFIPKYTIELINTELLTNTITPNTNKEHPVPLILTHSTW